MGTSNTFADQQLKLFFNGTAIPNIADNAGSSPLTSVYFSLHTANPGASGNQSSSEAAYTSYARVPVGRDTGNLTVTTTSVSPVANVVFPTATGGTETETYFGIGTASSGAGELLYSGPISGNIPVTTSTAPILTTASTVTIS